MSQFVVSLSFVGGSCCEEGGEPRTKQTKNAANIQLVQIVRDHLACFKDGYELRPGTGLDDPSCELTVLGRYKAELSIGPTAVSASGPLPSFVYAKIVVLVGEILQQWTQFHYSEPKNSSLPAQPPVEEYGPNTGVVHPQLITDAKIVELWEGLRHFCRFDFRSLIGNDYIPAADALEDAEREAPHSVDDYRVGQLVVVRRSQSQRLTIGEVADIGILGTMLKISMGSQGYKTLIAPSKQELSVQIAKTCRYVY